MTEPDKSEINGAAGISLEEDSVKIAEWLKPSDGEPKKPIPGGPKKPLHGSLDSR